MLIIKINKCSNKDNIAVTELKTNGFQNIPYRWNEILTVTELGFYAVKLQMEYNECLAHGIETALRMALIRACKPSILEVLSSDCLQ